MDRLLSAREVAAMLGVSYRTAYRMIRGGEIPAMRVGGVYRVSESELARYLESSRVGGRGAEGSGASDSGERWCAETESGGAASGTSAEEALSNKRAAEGPATCGLCKRIIGDASAAKRCSSGACEELLCRVCASAGEEHCIKHRPTREERLTEARAALARGDVCVLVSSEFAAAMEQEFIGGFREQITQVRELVHPMSGETLKVGAGEIVVEDDDELRRLSRGGGNTPRFGWGIAHPRNARAVATVGWGKDGVAVVAEYVSHITSHARDGFDCAVSGSDDLKAVGDELVALSESRGGIQVIASLASPTGWDDEARDTIKREWSSKGGARCVMTMLVDPRDRKVLNAELLPEALLAYSGLFEKEAPFARRRRVRQFAEEWFLLHDSLALEMAAQDLGVPVRVVRDVFNEMASSGTYRFELIKGAGWVIYPRPAEVA